MTRQVKTRKPGPLADRVLWAVTKSFWLEAALVVVAGLISSHQGIDAGGLR